MEDRIAQHAQRVASEVGKGRLLRTQALKGDASTRRYVRLFLEGACAESWVLMILPEGAESEERTKVKADRLPFLDVQEFLERKGLPVPEIVYTDLSEGLVYLEDLGDLTFEGAFEQADRAARIALYQQAISLLVDFQIAGDSEQTGCIAYRRRFDFEILRWELDHFRQWLLEAGRGVTLVAGEARVVDEEFDVISRQLDEAPRSFVHRDFQSRNLMVRQGRLRLIDFQDATIGPLPYDLVGLLRDSYIELERGDLDQLVAYYLERRPFAQGREAFREWFDLQTVQRKLKDAGRFVYIARVKNNDSFLPSIPPSLRYVGEALERLPKRERLREVLARHLVEITT